MRRPLTTYPTRAVQSLDGVWDFSFLGSIPLAGVDVTAIRFDDLLPVPGCFDQTPRYANRRGVAAYRTWAPITEPGAHRIHIESVLHRGRVFVAGKLVAEQPYGYTAFDADFIADAPGDVEVVVLVDNRFDAEASPLHQPFYDWRQHGGIHRSVTLMRLHEPAIRSVDVRTLDWSKRHVQVRLRATAKVSCTVPLVITWNDQPADRREVKLAAGSTDVHVDLTFPDAALWSPEAPNLHLLHVQLGDDVWRHRVGVRQITIDGPRILLNGQPLQLVGVNRHELHPQFGAAISDALHIEDLQLIRDLGCNFIRGSHYPPDPPLLDLCDELGVCFWAESLGWGVRDDLLGDETFMHQLQQQTELMVEQHSHHPSVIFWGVLNEAASDTQIGRKAFARLLNRLRELDPTRPATYATNRARTDICLDLADVVSINTYPGWYTGELPDLPAILADIIATVDRDPAIADKPMMITEIGAGAIPGWRDRLGGRWSEQYQADYVEAVLNFVASEPRLCGLAIWQYCDIRINQDVPNALGRPRCFNNKGLVSEYRDPKLAYDRMRDWLARRR